MEVNFVLKRIAEDEGGRHMRRDRLLNENIKNIVLKRAKAKLKSEYSSIKKNQTYIPLAGMGFGENANDYEYGLGKDFYERL